MPYSVDNVVLGHSFAGATLADSPDFAVAANQTLLHVALCNMSDLQTPTISDVLGTNDTWTQIGTGIYAGIIAFQAFIIARAAAGISRIRCDWTAVGTDHSYPQSFVAVLSRSFLKGKTRWHTP